MSDNIPEKEPIAAVTNTGTDMLRDAPPPPQPSAPPSGSIAGVPAPSNAAYTNNFDRANIAVPETFNNSMYAAPLPQNREPGGNVAGLPSISINGELDPAAAQSIRDRVDWSPGSRNSIAALSDAAFRNGLTIEGGQYRPMNMADRDAAGLTTPQEYMMRNQQRMNDLNQVITANAKNQFDGPARIAAAQHSIASLADQNKDLVAGLQVNAGLEGKRLAYSADMEGKRLDNAAAIAALPARNALLAAQAREADAHGKYYSTITSPQYLDRQNRAIAGREDLQMKRDISTRLRDAQRSYAAALRTGDPDSIASAVDTISALNEHAGAYGVPQLPTPKRPMTTEETEAIRAQATANLKKKRGAVGQFFNTSPSQKAINAETARLKGQAPPQSAPLQANALGSNSNAPLNLDTEQESILKAYNRRIAAGQTLNPRQEAIYKALQLARQAAAAPQTSNAFPGADQHNGRIIRDNTTGQRYQSNGTHWLEIR